jgi:hypothetical protein
VVSVIPKGIAVIEFDQFEGAVVSLQYPEDLQIPINAIQQIQVSHTFTPGMIYLKEENLSAITLWSEETQKIVVLVLDQYEDGEDFHEILTRCNEILISVGDDLETLGTELENVFTLSQQVFRAREAVLEKMAKEIQDLKNRELDIRIALNYLMTNEPDHQYRIMHALMLYGPSTLDSVAKATNLSIDQVIAAAAELEKSNKVENRQGILHLLIIYQ